MSDDKIIAIGLLTRRDLDALGQGFRRVYSVESGENFSDLLERLDQIIPDHEFVDRTEIDMQRRAEENANPLAPPINNWAGG